jgi:hypothetical protein
MVSVEQDFPEFVLDGDVETYIELADPPADVRSRLRDADGDDRVRLLARGWLRHFHGSRNEAKRIFVLLMRERDIPISGEDIQAITDSPPVETQT